MVGGCLAVKYGVWKLQQGGSAELPGAITIFCTCVRALINQSVMMLGGHY